METEKEKALIRAMEEAGFAFDRIESSAGNLRFFVPYGTIIQMESWKETEKWLEDVVLDDPKVLHRDRFTGAGRKQTKHDLSGKKEETAADMAEEERRAEDMEKEYQKEERDPAEEITVKFAKGLVGEPFVSKKGVELVEIKIPNKDPADQTPWVSFVADPKKIHDSKYGKGVWMKLPADGHTTIKKTVCTADDGGKRVYRSDMATVSNQELKELVEYYRNQNRNSEETARTSAGIEQKESVVPDFLKNRQPVR